MRNIHIFREHAGHIPVRFTHHAINRLRESQLDLRRGKYLLYEAVNSPFKVDWNKKKYTENQENTTFWMNGTVIYTVMLIKDRVTKDDLFLVITVTDSRCVDRYAGMRTRN